MPFDNEYHHVLSKFLEYIDATDIIRDFIKDCGEPSFDLEDAFNKAIGSYGRSIFILGDTDQQEVANVYGIMKHIHENNLNVVGFGQSYTNSRKFQDMAKEFNERVIMVFIRHIEGYLTKIGIDMGMDENIKYSITVNNGQVNLASDNSVINATQNNGIDSIELSNLILQIKNQIDSITDTDDKVSATESLEVIENEAKADKPKKNMIKTALSALQAIKGSAEFAAAVFAIVQFFQ